VKHSFLYTALLFSSLSLRAHEIEVNTVNHLDFGCQKAGAKERKVDPEGEGSGQLYTVGESNKFFRAALKAESLYLEDFFGNKLKLDNLLLKEMDESTLDSLGYGELRLGGSLSAIPLDQKPGRYSLRVRVFAYQNDEKENEKAPELSDVIEVKACVEN